MIITLTPLDYPLRPLGTSIISSTRGVLCDISSSIIVASEVCRKANAAILRVSHYHNPYHNMCTFDPYQYTPITLRS